MTERWLWWAKRDLRLHDNAALRHIVDSDYQCLALFVFEPSLGDSAETSPFHALAQGEALTDLNRYLSERGGELQVAIGEVVEVLDALFQKTGFTGIASHEETGTQITFSRDKAVARWAKRNNVRWLEFPQNGVVRGLSNRDERQRIIWQRIWDTPIQSAPKKVIPWSVSSSENVIDENNPLQTFYHSPEKLIGWSERNNHSLSMNQSIDVHSGRQFVTEAQARLELTEFINERGVRYSGGISSPNKAFTSGSRLSTHLAWGTLSLRTAFHETMTRMGHLKEDKSAEAVQWKKSLRGFQARLHWHDHFIQRLESSPSMEFTALNPAYKNVQYLEDNDEMQIRLYAWRCGQTGIPIVDACMRCLMTTGFLNFRMRAMLVTTACFGLQLHWRELLHPLAQVFADYEPGIHLSQIQMQAGMVGINTLRVYSPHKQLLDQDPDAIFVRRWVPELQSFSAEQISRYETEPLGDYVRPITDINANAKAIKDQLYAIRQSSDGKISAQKTLQAHGSRLSRNERSGKGGRKKAKKSKLDKQGAEPQMSFDWS